MRNPKKVSSNKKPNWFNDEAFLAELDRRVTEYKSGKVKGISWEEAQQQILASRKTAPRRGH